jgi:hypothetical protein
MMKLLIVSLAVLVLPTAAFAPNQAASPFGISSSRFSTTEADVPTESSEVISTEKLRNIAVIAHVDHGKTTLVRCVLYITTRTVTDSQLYLSCDPDYDLYRSVLHCLVYVTSLYLTFFVVLPSSFLSLIALR